jgi:REP-associated tyrosine transposase
MPARNALKLDAFETYYHAYARGANKQPIFLDTNDRVFFISLFKRYLSGKVVKNKAGESYPNYHDEVKLLAYCLMENHFHLLLYQLETGTMTAFMRSLLTSYSKYFNHKYKRTGPMFEGRYKAKDIDSQAYLDHISRYIHMNPRYWLRYKYSSLCYYAGIKSTPKWLHTQPVTELFDGTEEYLNFLKSYEDHKKELEDVKHNLANF